ncbi:MAG: M48 family metalloprotease, partial [Deltaproteobacteria bacterium]
MTDLYTQQRNNRRATVWLISSFIVIITILGLGVDVFYLGFDSGIPVATSFALTFSAANGLFSFYKGDSLILTSLRAVPLDFNDLEHKKLHNVVTEMAIASGLPMPKIYVIMDPAPNAFATGRDPEHAILGVTQGLLTTMNREELQGVVAHEMGHIKNYDIRLMMVVTVLLGTIVLLS